MRSRVLQHFIATSSWTPRVRRIEWQRTAGELGALLREAALVKELDPVYNRQLRRPGGCAASPSTASGCASRGGDEIDAETLPFVYGIWRSRRAAMQALRGGRRISALPADAGFRCEEKRNLPEASAGALRRRVRWQGEHPRAPRARRHRPRPPEERRLAAPRRRSAWSRRTRAATPPRCMSSTAGATSAPRSRDAEIAELLEARRPRFDYDHYRILSRHLGKRGVRVVELAA